MAAQEVLVLLVLVRIQVVQPQQAVVERLSPVFIFMFSTSVNVSKASIIPYSLWQFFETQAAIIKTQTASLKSQVASVGTQPAIQV